MQTMKNWLMTLAVAGAIATGSGQAWGVSGTSAAVTVRSGPVAGHVVAGYVPFKVGNGDEAGLWLDGAVLFSSVGEKTFDWQPQTTGNHTIEFRLNGVAVTSKTVNVESLAFAVQKGPNPPTAADGNLSITPVARNFGTGGGGAAIVVSGSGTWQASVSDNWITLNATSGAAGTPVAYVVGAATNAEPRTGYVYVSGYVHTVTQDGLGATISPESATFESAGGTGKITVTPPDRMSWQARANVDWVNVSPTSGTGNGTVTFTVAPLNEAVTRQGTLSVGGQTFTVFQYGRRIKISPKQAEYDYLTHVIPIVVDALAITTWSVEPQNSWISVVDGGRGQGGGTVTVAIGENPSWKARTGTVKIGTETFTVTQKGRTALEFAISPTSTTASVEGANGMIAVTATPDLPWSAASQANWLTIYGDTGSGAGNGNVMYSAAPNPTLDQRTGKIVVTPGDTKVSAKTHTVTQPAATSALSANGYEFAAVGESCEVRVSLSDIVQWQIENKLAWLTVSGSTNRVGPGNVVLQAAPNDTVQPRSGTVTIAKKTFKVSQKARGVEVEYDTKLFGTDGGSDSISIHPDGQVSWTAVSSDKTWITIFGGGSGTGDGEILYIVSPYVGDGEARTGTITVGDKVVYISQRTYDLSLNPSSVSVSGNNGKGEFGVETDVSNSWTAIATETWISLVAGGDGGMGSGVVKFTCEDNDTGKIREGKIIVGGEVFTVQQQVRTVEVFPEAGDEAEVAAALAGAADGRLGEKIRSVEEYEAFRAWIAEKGLDQQEVKESKQAWISYALGAEELFENEPDIQIAGFTPDASAARRRAAGFTWQVRVTVKNGDATAAVDAAKVAALFEATRQIGDWSEASRLPLTVCVKGQDGDCLVFDVTIELGTATGAFLRFGGGEATVVDPEKAGYLIVDLSAGAEASSYPVSYRNEEPDSGFNTDEYKTTKLVLRRIEAGAFTMGSPSSESGHVDDETQHKVTLSKPYYIGLFEVTQKQYELVMGSNPSGYQGDKRPVENVSWNTIRGDNGWPSSSAVSASSFMGRMRERTGLEFDLPTEAQWEYACRAGTTTDYSYGDSTTRDYMWFAANSSKQTHEVGTKKANAWGLYDMHGNVGELCLDWYASSVGTEAVTDPKGASSGSYRVYRGGSWNDGAADCRSAIRFYDYPSLEYGYLGFRLSRVLSAE